MKKYIIPLIIVICLYFPAGNVKAETLNQYIAKAESSLAAAKAAREKKKLTEAEKTKALAEKEEIEKEIADTQAEIERLTKEVEELQKKITIKDKEIKNLMKFVQVSNGESAYLEYAFGASSFTDFIYRMSVAEQLSSYNEQLIKEFNQNIKDLEQKQKELTVKEAELNKKQEELAALIQKLSAQIDDLSDAAQSSQDEYNNFMNYVNMLKSMGCTGNEDMSSCRARLYGSGTGGGGGTPYTGGGGNANGFYIPLTQGRITQGYKGPYTHNAVDMSNYEGAPVYSITDGYVAAVSRGCGENVVYIIHPRHGNYTTVFYHLKSVTVSRGQAVTYQTQIGTQGGNPAHGATCGCTGSHIDVKLFTGEYLRDFFSLTGDGARYNTDVHLWLTHMPYSGSFSGR